MKNLTVRGYVILLTDNLVIVLPPKDILLAVENTTLVLLTFLHSRQQMRIFNRSNPANYRLANR